MEWNPGSVVTIPDRHAYSFGAPLALYPLVGARCAINDNVAIAFT
jgi:hypothetical protein